MIMLRRLLHVVCPQLDWCLLLGDVLLSLLRARYDRGRPTIIDESLLFLFKLLFGLLSRLCLPGSVGLSGLLLPL